MAVSLRARRDVAVEQEYSAVPTPPCAELESVESDIEPSATEPRVIWYEDSAMRQAHHELVKAGMERARQQGKRIGRPRVSERPEFPQRFAAVAERIGLGDLSRRQAAKELVIGYATLSRLLDNRPQPLDQTANESSPTASADGYRATNAFAGVLY